MNEIKENKIHIILEKMKETKTKLIDLIEWTLTIIQSYADGFFDEAFDEKKEQTDKENHEQGERFFRLIFESIQRNDLCRETVDILLQQITRFVTQLNIFANECVIDRKVLNQLNNQTISRIRSIEGKIEEQEVMSHFDQREKIVTEYKESKSDWDKYIIETDEVVQFKKDEQKRHAVFSEWLTYEEMEKLEEWTGLKCKTIIFDSQINRWNQKTSFFGGHSSFDQIIFGKDQLIILIEDEKDNIFGTYISQEINKYSEDDSAKETINERQKGTICDRKAFVFSVRSNGRFNTMIRFPITQKEYAFSLFSPSDERLFTVGESDICLKKENTRQTSFCYPWSFNYNAIPSPLCGDSQFDPKRFIVITLE